MATKIQMPTEGGDTRLLWKSVRDLIQSHEDLKRQIFTLTQENQALRANRNFSSFGLHPFKIYRYPDYLRSSAASTDWRKFIVRAGLVSDVAPGSVTGSDLVADAYSDTLPSSFATYETTVADTTAAHYFWIELGTGTAVIDNGTTPPDFDGTNILIGYVDTNTFSSSKRALVRQYLTDHIVNPRVTLCISGVATDDCILT